MKITATVDNALESNLLRDQADFDRLAESIAPREEFKDKPERYPCLMLSRPWATPRSSGADIVENFFLYDFIIHEGAEELENYWRLEDEGFFGSTDERTTA